MSIKGDYPIILAHGICRFDQLLNVTFGLDNQDDDRLHYFKCIRSTLIEDGFTVFHSNVGWAAGVETRADQLKEQLHKYTNGFQDFAKVHIIAHSMGGLDARHMIYKHRMQDRVASVTTIGTPHHGSGFADWGVKLAEAFADLLKPFGIDLEGFKDLTSEKCKAFNDEAEAFERSNGVKYQAYVGIQPLDRVFLPLRVPYSIIEKREGPNDGLVSLESAKWRDDVFVKQIDADHLNEVGWCDFAGPEPCSRPNRFERQIRDVYLEIARGL